MTNFHHDVRGHGAGVTPPRRMRVDLFFCDFPTFYLRFSYIFSDFPTDVSLLFSLCLSLFIFLFIGHCITYFCFGLAYSLRQAGLLKIDKVKVDFQNSIFQVFFGI